VPVIEHFPAKFYLLSDQSFLWPDMWPDQFRLVKSPISKNCLFNTFLLMKPLSFRCIAVRTNMTEKKIHRANFQNKIWKFLLCPLSGKIW
jgi:hypothetical protein